MKIAICPCGSENNHFQLICISQDICLDLSPEFNLELNHEYILVHVLNYDFDNYYN